MAIFIIILMFLFFYVYPTIGIFIGSINIKGKTINRDETPYTFWTMVIFLYFSGVAFPCIMLQIPHSFFFIPVMVAMFIFIVIFSIFKM